LYPEAATSSSEKGSSDHETTAANDCDRCRPHRGRLRIEQLELELHLGSVYTVDDHDDGQEDAQEKEEGTQEAQAEAEAGHDDGNGCGGHDDICGRGPDDHHVRGRNAHDELGPAPDDERSAASDDDPLVQRR
jgi:hypothetical protein